jgi:DUF1680 family protein
MLLVCGAAATCAGQSSDVASSIDSRAERRLGKRLLESFNHDGVTLSPGMHRSQIERVREYYMRLAPNDVLRGFRLKSKKWAPGKELGGAYSERPLSFGQWLAGFARLAASTGDAEVRHRALYLMHEWGKTISDDGSYGYKEGQGSHYDYDKMVGGLVDMYEYLGSDEAIEYLDRITDWAEKNLTRTNEYALPREWYTLAENLYRAYELTGDRRYYEFAQVWEYDRFWDAFAKQQNVFEALKAAKKHPSYHAYSHVNSLSSAAMAYSATGKPKYLDTLVNSYDFLKKTQLYATGGYGPEECFVVPDGMPVSLLGIRRGESNVDVRFHFETSCGSWAGFKMARYLMEFTGEAKYGDWIERLIYNGVGALAPMNDYGMIMYGSSYNLYGAQKSLSTVWFCCQGSLPQTVAEYHNLIYFRDDQNIYVNLFVPSKVDWQGAAGKVTVVQETQFPQDGAVKLTIDTDEPTRFGLKVRVPQWSKQAPQVLVNGEPFEVDMEPGTWATIEREWSAADVVNFSWDLSPRGEPIPGYVSPVAVMCGPVVMVQAAVRGGQDALPKSGPLRFPADYVSVNAQVRVDEARNLHTNQEFRPFYDIGLGEYYRMYFNREGRKPVTLEQIEFDDPWQKRGAGRVCSEAGATFEAQFNGTAIVWEGRRLADAGIALVSIDGEELGEVDQYSYTGVHVGRMDQREVPFRWSHSGLSSGKHTIEVTVVGKKNALSGGTEVNVSGLSAYP